MEGKRPIVIDHGSSTCRAGFAGDKLPGVEIPTIVAHRRYRSDEQLATDYSSSSRAPMNKDFYVGHEAKNWRGIYSLKRPIVMGVMCDHIEMEKIWEYLIDDQLGVDSSDHPVLATYLAHSIKSMRDSMWEIFFEKLRVPSLHWALNAALSLHASGHASGTVVDSGAETTYIVPIHEGVAIGNAIGRTDYAGAHATDRLQLLLRKRGYKFLASQPQRELVDDIKKTSAFVYPPIEFLYRRHGKSKEQTFKLPDGQIIEFGIDATFSAEGLFNPCVYGLDRRSLLAEVYNARDKSRDHLCAEFSENVVLSGGSTLIPGFAKRLEQEYNECTSPAMSIRVIEPPNRQYSAWIGGSMIASDPSFRGRWISKQDYDEVGPSIVERGFKYIV